MIHKYPTVAQIKEFKMEPKEDVIAALLNYSKSTKTVKLSKKKVLLNFN